MKPDVKKWRAARKEGVEPPFQIALFIRTEAGRMVEVTIDKATPEMRQAAYDLLCTLSGVPCRPAESDWKPEERAQRGDRK